MSNIVLTSPEGDEQGYIYTPCITLKNGKKLYHPKWFTEKKVFRFKPKKPKSSSVN